MHRHCGALNIGPAVIVADFHTSGISQIFAIHNHGRFAIERRCVERTVVGQTGAHGGQNIVNVILGAKVQRLDPTSSTPDWSFLHADVDDVVLAAASGCIGRDLLAQNTLFQSNPI